jgi:hypothetical protein
MLIVVAAIRMHQAGQPSMSKEPAEADCADLEVTLEMAKVAEVPDTAETTMVNLNRVLRSIHYKVLLY